MVLQNNRPLIFDNRDTEKKIGINMNTVPSATLDVNGSVNVSDNLTVDNVEATRYIHFSDGDIKMQGKAYSSSYRTWQVQGWVNPDGSPATGAGKTIDGRTNILEAFLYNSDISYLSIYSKGYNWLIHNSTGNDLRLLCKTFYCNTIYVNGVQKFTSDDRLKHNETLIIDALSAIRKLSPQVYDKASEFNDTTNTFREAGFIAQEVYEIPELKDFVNLPETDPDNPNPSPFWSLNYSSIFTYNIQAVKELDSIVQNQQTEINDLKSKIASLETKLNELLNKQ